MSDSEVLTSSYHSNFDGEPGDVDVGDEVEFTLARKTNKVSAESIRKLKPGTVAPEEVVPGVVDGKIIRCMRIVNPEQDEYPGLVQVGENSDKEKEVSIFGWTDFVRLSECELKGKDVSTHAGISLWQTVIIEQYIKLSLTSLMWLAEQ